MGRASPKTSSRRSSPASTGPTRLALVTSPARASGWPSFRSIARVHGGEATAARAPGGGAIFRVVLPRMSLPFTGLS